jgi:hypothetical protein
MAPSGIATDRQRFMARIALLRTFILLRVNVLTILWLDKRQKVSQLAVFFVVLAKDPSIHRRFHPFIIIQQFFTRNEDWSEWEDFRRKVQTDDVLGGGAGRRGR